MAGPQPIRGVNVAAVTPRGKDGCGADVGAMLDQLDFLGQAGAEGIALLGSTGEFAGLDFDDRVRLTYMGVKRCRVPVLAGVAHATLAGALELGHAAVSAGAAGLLLMPPYFFRYEQADVRQFFLEYAARIGRGVPVYLYNIPFFTTPIECETSLELLATGLFAGIKDSSGSLDDFARLKEQAGRTPFTLLIGHDGIFTRARAAGADGVVSGCACAVPELLVAIDRAILAGKTEAAERLDARLQEFIAWLMRFPTPVGVRVAAAERGIRTGPHSVPLASSTERALDEFREWFRGWLPGLQKECAGA